MTVGFRPMTEHLREAERLPSDSFLKEHRFPMLLWPRSKDLREDTPLQFETYESEYGDKEPADHYHGTESQIAQTLVVEIRKQASSATTNMIYVGRAADNDIVLANHTVSKLHAYFLPSEQGGSYEIADANSTNGTKLNNRRLAAYENHPIFNGDRIQFGPSIQMVYLTPQGLYELLRKLPRSGSR